jgi:hypothetical protein
MYICNRRGNEESFNAELHSSEPDYFREISGILRRLKRISLKRKIRSDIKPLYFGDHERFQNIHEVEL